MHLHNPGDGDFLGGVCMHYNIDHCINISLDPRFLCREPGTHGLLVQFKIHCSTQPCKTNSSTKRLGYSRQLASSPYRPLPDFISQPWRKLGSPQLQDKIWEWPWDEASHQLCSLSHCQKQAFIQNTPIVDGCQAIV